MRDSGQKNAPHLKKGGECPPDLLRPATVSGLSLLTPPGLPMAAAGRPAAVGVGIITIMRLSADGLRLVVALDLRRAYALRPGLPRWSLVPALPCSPLPVAVPVLSLMVAQQQRTTEAQSRSAKLYIVRIRTK